VAEEAAVALDATDKDVSSGPCRSSCIAQALTLTRDGERVLEQKADRIKLLGVDRWVGVRGPSGRGIALRTRERQGLPCRLWRLLTRGEDGGR
jgi:hypothetical protein